MSRGAEQLAPLVYSSLRAFFRGSHLAESWAELGQPERVRFVLLIDEAFEWAQRELGKLGKLGGGA